MKRAISILGGILMVLSSCKAAEPFNIWQGHPFSHHGRTCLFYPHHGISLKKGAMSVGEVRCFQKGSTPANVVCSDSASGADNSFEVKYATAHGKKVVHCSVQFGKTAKKASLLARMHKKYEQFVSSL